MTFQEWWAKRYPDKQPHHRIYSIARDAWYAAIDQMIFQQQRLPEPKNEPAAIRDHRGTGAIS